MVAELFRVLTESSLAGVCLIEDGRFQYANPAIAHLFGYKVEELLGGISPLDLVDLVDRPAFAENVLGLLKTAGEQVRRQVRGVRKNGSSIPVEVLARRVEYAGKTGLAATFIDCSDLLRAFEDLRASEERLRTFVDRATDAFFIIDRQGIVRDVNPQACVSLGYSREELISMHVLDFDAGLDEASLSQIRRRFDAGEIFTFETRHRRKDGSVFPVEIRSGPSMNEGIRAVAMARDITERKEAEETIRRSEAYMAAAESLSKSGSWAWRPASNEITHWSQGRYRLFGFDPAAGVPSLEAIIERIHPEDRRVWLESKGLVARGGESDLDFRIFIPGGETKHVHAVGRPILNESGEVVEIIGAAVDVTDQKKAQEGLREMQAQLAHANRLDAMGQLTASIAHEVNQPIAAMLANAQAALRYLNRAKPDTDEARHALERIVRDAVRAGDVVQRIRGLSKKASRREEAVEIDAAVREVIELTRREAMKHRISVRTELAAGLPLVRGDRIELQQVVLNLVLNAIEAMIDAEEPRDLLIATGKTKSDEVLVTVADRGPGLAPHVQENLFKAFTTTKPNGLGLGLSICRSIVESHQGRVWVSANQPHGSVFQFALPSKMGEARLGGD